MKKFLLTLLCLLMMITLSACHIYIDTDPWPASPDAATTEAPLATDDATEDPAPVEPTPSPATSPTDEPATQDING